MGSSQSSESESEGEAESVLLDLPNELILNILSELTSARDLVSLRLTNRRFNILIQRNMDCLLSMHITKLTFSSNYNWKSQSLLGTCHLDLAVEYGKLRASVRYRCQPLASFDRMENKEEYSGPNEKVCVIRPFPNKEVVIYTDSSLQSITCRLSRMKKCCNKLAAVSFESIRLDAPFSKCFTEGLAKNFIEADSVSFEQCTVSVDKLQFNRILSTLNPSELDIHGLYVENGTEVLKDKAFYDLVKNMRSLVAKSVFHVVQRKNSDPQLRLRAKIQELALSVDDDVLLDSKLSILTLEHNEGLTVIGANCLLKAWLSGKREIRCIKLGFLLPTRGRDLCVDLFDEIPVIMGAENEYGESDSSSYEVKVRRHGVLYTLSVAVGESHLVMTCSPYEYFAKERKTRISKRFSMVQIVDD